MLQTLKKMEANLVRKQKVLAEMREDGSELACDHECRLIGYKNAIDDVKIIIEAEVDDMAKDAGADDMPVVFDMRQQKVDIQPLGKLLDNER